MPVAPYREAGDDEHYSRLFAPSVRPEPDAYREALFALAETMGDDGKRVCEGKPEIPIDAGYTYFGQFLDHALTCDPTRPREVWTLEDDQLKNERTSRLDLDHLYGVGPNQGEASAHFESDGARLKVGPVIDSLLQHGPEQRSFDLGIDERGNLLIGDDRAADNLILREITAVFARLHNRAVEQFRATISNPAELFEKAQRQSNWQFQRLICYDYLPQILDAGVYRSVFLKKKPKLKWQRFTVPVEFSGAAMRFGHSMVRDTYFLSEPLDDRTLVEIRAFGHTKAQLDPVHEIDWGFLFQNASASTPLSAQPIDTKIAATLLSLEHPPCLLYDPGATFSRTSGKISLPVVSMWRGAGLRLASGRVASEAFGHAPLTETELTTDSKGVPTAQGDVIKSYGLLPDPPLFYYLLKEAEVRNDANTLGPTGSQIIAETIYGALAADEDSIFRHPDAAKPILWDIAGGKEIKSLNELFALAPVL